MMAPAPSVVRNKAVSVLQDLDAMPLVLRKQIVQAPTGLVDVVVLQRLLTHLHDCHVAVVLAALHVKDGGVAVQPQPRDVEPRAHQASRIVAQVQDETLSAAPLHQGG